MKTWTTSLVSSFDIRSMGGRQIAILCSNPGEKHEQYLMGELT
jgi:hypothetical protein